MCLYFACLKVWTVSHTVFTAAHPRLLDFTISIICLFFLSTCGRKKYRDALFPLFLPPLIKYSSKAEKPPIQTLLSAFLLIKQTKILSLNMQNHWSYDLFLAVGLIFKLPCNGKKWNRLNSPDRNYPTINRLSPVAFLGRKMYSSSD